MDKQNPDQRADKPHAETHGKNEKYDWLKKFIPKGMLLGIWTFSMGAPLNFWGSNPRVLYFPAIVTCVVIMYFTHDYISSQLAPKQPPPAVSPATKTTPIPLPVYISGTKTTHSQLQQDFPFGYVIYSAIDGRFTHEPHPGEHMEWKADWSKVTITPNFSTGMVEWRLNNFNIDGKKSGEMFMKVTNANIRKEFRIVVGEYFPFDGIYIQDEPEMIVGTLGDNQRTPVFVLGFKILPHPPFVWRKRGL